MNGKEAIDVFSENPDIDIILTDIKLPVMNGLEACSKIKESRPDIPVIVQTAFASKENEAEAKAHGCDAFISKPIDKDELLYYMIKYLLKIE
jgi:CheY-like chemotaxis protein